MTDEKAEALATAEFRRRKAHWIKLNGAVRNLVEQVEHQIYWFVPRLNRRTVRFMEWLTGPFLR